MNARRALTETAAAVATPEAAKTGRTITAATAARPTATSILDLSDAWRLPSRADNADVRRLATSYGLQGRTVQILRHPFRALWLLVAAPWTSPGPWSTPAAEDTYRAWVTESTSTKWPTTRVAGLAGFAAEIKVGGPETTGPAAERRYRF